MVTLTINGQQVTASPEKSILDVCHEQNIDHIPTLCYDEKLAPFGSCFLCVVEVEGQNRIRITSYNVCYTKLLRGRRGRPGRVPGTAGTLAHRARLEDVGGAARAADHGLGLEDVVVARAHVEADGTGNRITSYNVCYTKLLRNPLDLCGSGDGVAPTGTG